MTWIEALQAIGVGTLVGLIIGTIQYVMLKRIEARDKRREESEKQFLSAYEERNAECTRIAEMGVASQEKNREFHEDWLRRYRELNEHWLWRYEAAARLIKEA